MGVEPELSDVDLVILDEFHERSLHVDLALGLLRELQELGREIKILVMSATLEAEKFPAYLGQKLYHQCARKNYLISTFATRRIPNFCKHSPPFMKISRKL